MIAALIAVAAPAVPAAKAPLDPRDLEAQASHVVSGKVIELNSRTQRSRVETAPGLHRDRIFTIRIQVEAVAKGEGVRVGDQIRVLAWRPAKRIPRLPGLQGHGSIPDAGDSVTVHLVRKGEEAFEPLLPNGIRIDAAAGEG